MFENIIFSSPNGGGLFYLNRNQVYRLDSTNSTGLAVSKNTLARGIQPNVVRFHRKSGTPVNEELTGFDDVHDILHHEGHYYVVGTSRNEVIKLSTDGDEIHRWVYPGEPDSWHINCLAFWGGRIVFSAFGDFRKHRGYKGRSTTAGFIQDLHTGERLITGLSQPHSLACLNDNILVANSELREVVEFAPNGERLKSVQLDAYTRGIFVTEDIIYIGLSCSRNIESADTAPAAILALDRNTLDEKGRVNVPTQEIYEILQIKDLDFLSHLLAGVCDFSSESYCKLLEKRHCDVTELRELLAKSEDRIACLSNTVYEREAQINTLNGTLSEREAQINTLTVAVSVRDDQLASLNQIASLVLNSNSWIYTKNLRALGAKYRNFRNKTYRFCIELGNRISQSNILIQREGFISFFSRLIRFIKETILSRQVKNSFAMTVTELNNSLTTTNEGITASFIIPVFDRTDLLRDAITSALRQTYTNLEVLIVADGSPPDTLSVIEEYSEDARVRVFKYPNSSGNAVRGRNKGIIESRGKYIAFLDSDDVSSESRLELCLPILENNLADVVYGSWEAILDGSRDVLGLNNGQIVHSPDADLNRLLSDCIPCQSTVIARKELFSKFGLLKPNMEYREDHELWVRFAYFGARFKSVRSVLTKLRLHGGNNELNFIQDSSKWLDELRRQYKTKGPNPLKIGFILPGVGISGGIAVVFKHAEMLASAGHDVFIINLGRKGEELWYPSLSVPIIHVSDKRNYIFRSIDLLFATGWSTIEWLFKFKSNRYLYFVQSDERRFTEKQIEKEIIHNTYKTNCEYLTEALWIKELLKTEFCHDAAYVPNGIDLAHFYPGEPLISKSDSRLRVLIEGPIDIPFKGMADSYAAICDLDCEIWIVSSSGKPPKHWRYDRFFESVPFGMMRSIYSSCDIFLKMSRVEGFFGPPMEAMACGCACVVGEVTGHDEYIIHERNALVVPQGEVDSASIAVRKLIENNNLRKRLIKEGYKTVKEWSWERSGQAMLALIERDSHYKNPIWAQSNHINNLN